MAENETNIGCCNIELIYNNYYNKLKGYLVKKSGDIDLSEDIMQEAMLKLTFEYNKNTALRNPESWLYKVVSNSLSDHYRNSKVKYRETMEAFEGLLTTKQDDSNQGTEDIIIPMINLLPSKYGTALFLSDIENLSQKVIASKLNISLSAVKMRIQRGRRMLNGLFNQCCDIKYTKSGKFAHCSIKKDCLQLLPFSHQEYIKS